jgi:hypothetical protein
MSPQMRDPSVNEYIMVKFCFISIESGMMQLRMGNKTMAKSQPPLPTPRFKMLYLLAVFWMPYSYVRHGGRWKSIKY